MKGMSSNSGTINVQISAPSDRLDAVLAGKLTAAIVGVLADARAAAMKDTQKWRTD